ncbi:hypothetical protein DPMN_121537 [Dreissena polymorpha]|uniref:Uncharacterized protein n=1 Tax=Dreissena polymorpha TaxID=45954 RepID=A0A9D4GQ97_DREPO|nr:hypothetical protein DPMN_121537 [Dreissena polymorpha]
MPRLCLACAEVVFEQEEANDVVNCPDKLIEKLQQAKAYITRCLTKYVSRLIAFSREQLPQEAHYNSE